MNTEETLREKINIIWDKFDYYQNLDSVDMEGSKDIENTIKKVILQAKKEGIEEGARQEFQAARYKLNKES